MSNKDAGQKKSRRKRLLAFALIGAGILLVLTPFALAIYGFMSTGSWPQWTGFGNYTSPTVGADQDFQRGKTLWDWMDLLIVPIVLAIGALLFNWSERKSEREAADRRYKTEHEIADARQQEEALQNYLDKMTELLLERGLLAKKDAEDDPVIEVAKVRTVTTLRILDERHRSILFQFLRDANLIDFLLREASLNNADLDWAQLKKVDLHGARLGAANLIGADLSQAYLSRADLFGADLSEANLTGADLDRANLSGAELSLADLSKAILIKADLSEAVLFTTDLSMTNLFMADLSGANLTNAKVTLNQLDQAKLDKNTVMPDGEYYDPGKHKPPPPTVTSQDNSQ